MKAQDDTLAELRLRFGDRLALPEYRQIELSTKRKKLNFAEPPAASSEGPKPPNSLSTLTAFALLDAALESRSPDLEGLALWQKYLALPRKTGKDKLVAEVYRILRIYRSVVLNAGGALEVENGIVKGSCTHRCCALSLWISPIGLKLLESFVHHALDLERQPYSDAYAEALLMQYFLDIVVEIKKFADEDRVLYQFRRKYHFNRHFRFDCDNLKYEFEGERLVIDIGERFRDKASFPIDFYLIVQDKLYIVPHEALQDQGLLRSELPAWAAKTSDGFSLPFDFQTRFGRETMIVGLPMT